MDKEADDIEEHDDTHEDLLLSSWSETRMKGPRSRAGRKKPRSKTRKVAC